MPPVDPLKHALALYSDGICGNGIDQALEDNVGNRLVQHSSGITDGPDGFRDFYRDFLICYPGRKMKPIHKVVDGKLCFLHVVQLAEMASQWKPQWVTMDLFDTDDAGKIVEHWSVRASYQFSRKPGVDKKDDIEGVYELHPVSICQFDMYKTERNKQIVMEYVKNVLTLGNVDRLYEFITRESIRHLLHVPHTRECLAAAVDSVLKGGMEMLFKVIGQANIVVTVSKMYTIESPGVGGLHHHHLKRHQVEIKKKNMNITLVEYCPFDLRHLEKECLGIDQKPGEVEVGKKEDMDSGAQVECGDSDSHHLTKNEHGSIDMKKCQVEGGRKDSDKVRVEYCAFDVYRLENERIVEQWSVWEPIKPRNEWTNSGKF